MLGRKDCERRVLHTREQRELRYDALMVAVEVAALARRHAREHNVDLEITIITEELQPLALFGETVSAAVAGLLADADIRIMGGACVESASGKLIANPSYLDELWAAGPPWRRAARAR